MLGSVLLVTDDAALEAAVRTTLRSVDVGLNVTGPATPLPEAFARWRPNLLLVDLCSGERAVLAGVEALRAVPDSATVPVVFLGSGGETVRSATDALGRGGDYFLVRPLSAAELLERVADYLGADVLSRHPPDEIIPGPGDLLGEEAPPRESRASLEEEGIITRRRLTRMPRRLSVGEPVEEPTSAQDLSQVMARLDLEDAATRLHSSSEPPPRPRAPRAEPSAATWHPPAVARVEPPARAAAETRSPTGKLGSAAPIRMLSPSEGRFEEGQFPSLLWACMSQAVTGRLDLHRDIHDEGEPERQLFLEEGHPVYLRSRLRQDRMEEFLHARGLISAAQATQARVKNLASPRRLAAALAEEGLLKPREVFLLTREHLKDRVLALCELAEGRFRFIPDKISDAERVALDERPEQLLWRAIKRKYPLERILPLLGGPSTIITPVEGVDLARLGLREAEVRAAGALDGAHTLEDAVLSMGVHEETVYQVAFLLVTVDAAQISARGLEGVRPAGARGEVEIDRSRILEMRTRCREADYFQILGLTRDATRAEVLEALDHTRDAMDPQRYADAAFSDLTGALQEIATVLGECGEVLLDDRLRERYRAHLR
ncbi:MAG: DUF4388 domain-containing protein [Myxococcota bacterium]